MAAPLTNFEEYASNLIASGEFASRQEVLEAAMDALRRERVHDAAFDEECLHAMEESESSEVLEGDLVADVRSHFGLSSASGH